MRSLSIIAREIRSDPLMERHQPYTLPPPIERELVRLEGLLNDALWQRDETLATQLRRQIDRLRLLQSYGETHDLPF